MGTVEAMVENRNKTAYRRGLKLWSTNDFFIDGAINLFADRLYEYIELYVVPDSFKECISYWGNLEIPFVIHAPHYMHGMNLSDKTARDKNILLAKETFRYADALGAEHVIFHPGINGSANETVRQIKRIGDSRIVIENKPYNALNRLGVCTGHSVEEIRYIMDKGEVGFCLDFGHAVYAANALGIDPMGYLAEFQKLGPGIYHLCDGNYSGLVDEHLHLGHGTFPLGVIFQIPDCGAAITLETPKNRQSGLDGFVEDSLLIAKRGIQMTLFGKEVHHEEKNRINMLL